ncbi:helix-turn-helix transcriptional regulator [Novosphingobium clariflavum]|uniref:LuxR C-terminal-related transcriptional regulator n=1 Tax=Novosphingobium clariflavum TaxID=2029884 RepID=A0ABV6SAT8_9SPHN
MALTSNDETDLLIPLFQGSAENPRFSTFLERLRRRTQADYVSLILRMGDGAHAAIVESHAGIDLRKRARESEQQGPFDLDRYLYDSLRPGRVYSIGEMIDHDPVARADRNRRMAKLGISDERVVRIAGGERYSAWLLMARARECTAADSALLSSLAPYVAIAVENLVVMDRDRLAARINAVGLERTGKGWMLLDAEARVVAADPALAEFWQTHCGAALRPGERVLGLDLAAERKLAAIAAEMAQDRTLSARPLLLRDTPHIEALLMPAENAEALAAPAILALCTLPRPHSDQSAERLAAVFDLPRREAELAMALADGHSIAEAAERMGLTLETARNYSKRLYAKLGVRGQAELVRLVYQSSAVMA